MQIKNGWEVENKINDKQFYDVPMFGHWYVIWYGRATATNRIKSK